MKVDLASMKVTFTVDCHGITQEFSLHDEFHINVDNIDGELQEQAGRSAFWSAMAAEIEQMAADFDILVDKFFAHARQYAYYYLGGRGVAESKRTKDTLMDTAIILFSEDASQTEMLGYVKVAHAGWCKESGVTSTPDSLHTFLHEMYKYRENDWTYEAVKKQQNELQKRVLFLKAIAQQYGQRGVCLTSIASNMRAATSPDSMRLLARNELSRLAEAITVVKNASPSTVDPTELLMTAIKEISK